MKIERIILRSIILLLFSFSTKQMVAQVFPPDFLCVKADTLLWNIPSNNCGTFNSFDIYISDNFDGPYSLLISITNPTTDLYFDSNPLSETRYYYMESNYNCPGEPVLSSDTLSNLAPEVARINSVTVNGNTVEMSWQESDSPEVSAYIIYKTTPIGTVPIDTVYSGTTYVDVNASAGSESESYYVVALDECGNTSIFDFQHSTMLAEAIVDPCAQTINFTWNLYDNWPNGIGSQEVWLGLNGNSPIVVDTLSASDTSYLHTGINDTETYCFFIRAIQANTAIYSNSNELCFTLDIVQPMRNLFLKNTTVTATNEVELFWFWDADAEINTQDILRSSENENYEIVSSSTPNFPLVENNNVIDVGSNAAAGKLFYKLETIDDCDTIATSNYASTIYLSGEALENRTNKISWTAFDIEGASILTYDIYRVVGSNTSFLATVDSLTTSYIDVVNPKNEAESNVCYFVVANAIAHLPTGFNEPIASRSNTHCVEQLTTILMPNAFAPYGKNQEFRPVVVFGETVDYTMQIFDRWGAKLFESNNIDDGWDGRKEGNDLPQGTYVYSVKIVQKSGRVIEDSGVVFLLR